MAVYAACFHNLGVSLEQLHQLDLAKFSYQNGIQICNDYLANDSEVS